ncbi:MAG: STAS domain-containing protein [Acidimicrobiales bacterium]|nr:STAS domain-containing protein [Acidimicrobiales bacterium]
METHEIASARTSAVGAIPTPDWVVIAVSGEIDMATAPEALATVLAASKPETAGIVVDIRAVTFLDASGIRAFITARHYERDHGRDLFLRAPLPIVVRVLDICGVTDLVEPPAGTDPRSPPAAPSAEVRLRPVDSNGSARPLNWRPR